MVNDDDKKLVKKPIPLPRKSLSKKNKVKINESSDAVEQDLVFSQTNTEGKQFVRGDWKSSSESFVLEKSKQVKNEVSKLEKSMKSIIAKRRSVHPKTEEKRATSEQYKSESEPDDSVFFKISFNSPLTDDEKHSDSQSISFTDDISFFETELSPPPYPPPDLPDESVYDQMRSFSLSDKNSTKSTNSSSTFDESVNGTYKNVSHDFYSNCKIAEKEVSELDSLSQKDDRYETIDDCWTDSLLNTQCECSKPLIDIPESEVLNLHCNGDNLKNPSGINDNSLSSNIKYIIHLFDPLQESEEKNLNHLTAAEGQKISNDSSLRYTDLPSEKKPMLSSEKIVNLFGSEENSCSIKIGDMIMSNSKEGHYGKIKKIKKPENGLMSDTKLPKEPPPIPPRRYEQVSGAGVSEDTKILKNQFPLPVNEKFSENHSEEKGKPNDIMNWSSLKRVAKIVVDNLEHRASYISLSGRKTGKHSSEEDHLVPDDKDKTLNTNGTYALPQSFPNHSGVLFKPGGIQRWGVLSQRKLTLFANKDSPDVKETIPMDNMLSVQISFSRIGMENVAVNCFEISLSSRSQPLIFGVPSVSERHIWMRKLLESIGHTFPPRLSMDYTRAGWCYAKEGISCPWTKCSILLYHRTLHLSAESGYTITADLRKARNITLQTEGFPCDKVAEKGPLMLVDLQEKTLYLQMEYERETKNWETAITSAALKNGPTLCEQQLTKDDVPAIVDKCLNFVHTHGSFSEGIYRRNGSNRTVSQLLASFRCNAWAVQLNKDECTEFDVSSVLKRYFRDLPEPLLVLEIHDELGDILEVLELKEKIEKYKLALKKLPKINYLTARRLMGHLYFINKMKDKNLMGADNLAAIWGPTLLQVQEQVSLNSNCFKIEALIINDLISYYPEVFEADQGEVEREMKILEMLESYQNNSNTLSKKPSGELKIWVYLHSPKNMDNCVNVSISPQKTADEVCKELSQKINEPSHLNCLNEVVCNGHMTRPLNHSEKVFDTVLRWSYWDEADRKDNCLVLGKNELFRQVAQNAAKTPVIVCEELKFADQKSKSFKTYQFEFSQAKLFCYKDKTCSHKVGEWKIEDIVWYIGHEPKRSPNGRWSITFIEKHSIGPRTKEKPYFGNTICGSSEEQKFRLISAMLMAQYSKDILPTPNLLE